jgi:hypothetical protein
MNKPKDGFGVPAIMRNLILLGIAVTIAGITIPYFTDDTILEYPVIW